MTPCWKKGSTYTISKSVSCHAHLQHELLLHSTVAQFLKKSAPIYVYFWSYIYRYVHIYFLFKIDIDIFDTKNVVLRTRLEF